MAPSHGSSRRGFLARVAGAAGAVGAAGAGLAVPGLRPAQAASANGLGQRPSTPSTAPGYAGAQLNQALTPWLAGLSNRLSARCNVVCLGDSITEGVHASGPPSTGFENRWLARLTDLLRSRYPTQGVTGGGRGFIGATSTGETTFAWPATITGSPAAGSTSGPKASFVQLNAAGQAITFRLNGDSADIMWTQTPYGGTFSWSVDGGPASQVSTNGSSTVDGRLTRVGLGAVGPHTLLLSWVSGKANIDGVIEYAGDAGSGICVHDAGHYGWQTATWASALNGGTAAGPAAGIAALAPAAVIITLGANDQYAGVPPAAFQSRIQAIVTSLRARQASPLPAVILSMLPARIGQSGYTYPWSQYVTAAYNVAAADTAGPGGTSIVSVMDFTAVPTMPPADADVYGFWQPGDLVHPSNRGHEMIADCLAAFLSQG